MIPKLTVYAKYLYYLMVLIVEITCFSQDVQLLSACSDKFLTVQNDRIFANQNSESPQNFTIQSHQYTKQNMAPDIRITFYVKERGAYICFNQKWQPRLMKKKNLKDDHSCHFREAMDHGYSTFSSVKDPQKYLGFMRNGRPINYERIKNDEKCRRIFKRIIENSSNDVISNSAIVAYQETSTLSSTLGNRKTSSSRILQKTHSNKIDNSKPRNTSRAKGAHPVRHHHNESPLRHPHHQQNNINSYNNNSRFNDSFSSNSSSRNTKQLDNENFNTIYNNPSNNVNSNNNISDNNEKVTTHHIRHQHHRKMQQHQHQQSFSDISPTNDPEDQQGFVTNHDENNHNNENIIRNYNRDNWNKDEIDTTDNHSNNNSNNSTSNCSSDDSDNDKHLKGKKNVRGRNAHANEKQQNNKCNNRKSKKNNENVRHSRKSNQKNSHKINRTPEN
ncbi:GATA zinc finger domain-containing protein 14 [Chironomus tepperi]|uniref:GATA zinc finger domain-containing protein 14 n=1 Tax=Chironomus tepperi TaxID=113505 RepID=UPI00391F8B9D